MNPDVKALFTELVAQGVTLAWSQSIVVLILSGLIAGLVALLYSYFTKSGELRAVNENFATALSQLEKTTEATKRIEADIKTVSDRQLEEFKASLDRKKQLHQRFVEYYLEGAVDPLCARLIEYQIYYSSIAASIPTPSTTPEMPVEALSRVEVLFGANQIAALFFYLYSGKYQSSLSTDEAGALSEIALKFSDELIKIRDIAVQFPVENDAMVLSFRELPQVKNLASQIRQVFHK